MGRGVWGMGRGGAVVVLLSISRCGMPCYLALRHTSHFIFAVMAATIANVLD